MNKNLLTLFCLLWVGTVFAQNRTITGKVTAAEDGSALPGVSIIVKNSNLGTSTNIEGDYSINVPANATLVYSFVGFTPQEIAVGSSSVIDVALELDVQALSEVVVTGVGVATSKKRLAIAVESVKAEDMPKVPAASIDQALVGKIAGAQINSISGQPGQQAAILLRGINSLGTTQPMILVDGVQVNAGNNLNGSDQNLSSRLSDLDLSNVDRIEIVQGAAAATIYGAQGANGVIQIFTKKGTRSQKPRINFSSQTGFDNVIRGNLKLTDHHFYATDSEGYLVDGSGRRLTPDENGRIQEPVSNITGTTLNNKPYKEQTYDHLGRLFRKNILTQNSSISISGGSEASDYALTLSQTHQKSVVKGDYNRYNLSANIGIDLFKGFTFRSITQASYSENETGGITGANNIYSAIGTALLSRRYWDLLARDKNGDLISNAENSNSINPFYSNEYVDRLAQNTRIIQSFNFNYKFNRFLELDYKYGIDNYRYDYKMLTKYQLDVTSAGAGISPIEGRITYDRDSETIHNSLFSAFLKTDFENDFGWDIPIQTTTHFAYDWRKRSYQNVISQGTGFAPYPPYGLNATTSRHTEESITEFTTFGYLINQRIDYKSLFGVSGGVRVDYSSAFGAGSDPFVFPRGDAYFNIGEIINSNSLTYFKLRGAFGKAGIQPGPYDRRITLNSGAVGNSGTLYTKLTARNPLLDVEVSSEQEIGTDVGLVLSQNNWFSNVSLAATYWQRTSTGVIRSLDLSPSSGVAGILTNAIDLDSKGFQFSIDADVLKTNNFTWSFGTRFGHYKSVVKNIANHADITLGDSGSGEFVLKEGETVGAFFGYKYLTSIDQTDANGVRYISADNASQYAVVDGKVINKVTKAVQFTTDKYKIGDPTPKFNMSFINDFNLFKNIDINIQIDWVHGNDVYNQTRQFAYRDLIHSDFDNEITVDGETGAFVNYHYSLYNTNQTNNFFVENGSFVRLRNAGISYDMTSLLNVNFIKSLRLSVTGRNLFTITKYTGMDPESGASLNDPLRRGLDLHNFPNMRTVQFGVNVGF